MDFRFDIPAAGEEHDSSRCHALERFGGETAGPPLSRHSNRSRARWSLRVTDHWIETLPVLFNHAPYFVALVASSCRAIDKEMAVFGVRRTSGPDAWHRSGSFAQQVPTTASMAVRRDA